MTNTILAGVDFGDSKWRFTATVNPAYPWIHIPREDFTEFVNMFNSLPYPDNIHQKLQCQDEFGECRFKGKCSEILELVQINIFGLKTYFNG
jgi:hypothetical protein